MKWIFKSTQINLLNIDAADISSITFSARVLKGLINGWVFIFSSSETPYFHPLLVWKRKKKNNCKPQWSKMRTILMSESKFRCLLSHQTANPLQELLSATGRVLWACRNKTHLRQKGCHLWAVGLTTPVLSLTYTGPFQWTHALRQPWLSQNTINILSQFSTDTKVRNTEKNM